MWSWQQQQQYIGGFVFCKNKCCGDIMIFESIINILKRILYIVDFCIAYALYPSGRLEHSIFSNHKVSRGNIYGG
jgi:hypothetical protein